MLKRVLAAALLACAAFVPPAQAQLPDQTLRIIGGFAPGGTSDLVARLIANAVGPILNRTVVVENRTGANGFIAAEAVVRSGSDGTTLFQCPMGTMTISPELPGLQMSIDPRKDLIPVANVALSSYGAVVRADGPYDSMESFLKAARAKPGALTYASAGIGTAQHLSGERLQRMADLKLLHVPYRGAAPAALDIMSGRADFMITNLGDVMSQVQGGKLRLVALGDGSMKDVFPTVPLLSDSVPGLEIAGWFGLCGPRGMPESAVVAWAEATRRALQDPGLQKQLRDNGLTPLFEDPDTFAARMVRDRKAWGEVIAAAGVRVD